MDGDKPIRSSVQAEAGVKPASLFIPVTPPFTIDPSWALVEDGFSLAREHEIESICTVTNGYAGTRGSLAEGASLSSPATFLAGVFEASADSPASLSLVVLPDWTQLQVFVDRVPFSLETGDILEHRRILDLQHGLLYRTWRHRDRAGRVTHLQFVRMVSLHDRHLFLQSIMINPENYGGVMAIESLTKAQDGRIPRIQWLPKLEGKTAVIVGATTRGITMAMAHHSEVRNEKGQPVERGSEVQADGLLERWTWSAHMSEVVRFTRLVAVYSSRDTKDPAGAVRDHLRRAQDAGLDAHIASHVHAWGERWRAAGLEVVGDEKAQHALRVAAYHLTSAVNPNDEHSSIGARGLTGSVYKGHVFWDTEIYLLPFYTFTDPPAARALLMYRYHTLSAAREKARKLGYQGALYAWESADTGEDVTPDSAVLPDGRVVQILTGTQEHHISADIAYAVWQYWQATADEDFFVTAGVDILIETARFWATRGRLESDGRYHIRAVIGPDEYHETVDDNAYTNVMVQWNLERAADAVEWLRTSRPDAWRAIRDRVRVESDEPASWRRLAEVMATGFDPRTNLFEQFAGFFQLDDLDLEAYRARTLPIDIVLGHERTQKSKVIKQADVVALSALLWDRFPYAVHEANFRYYEPRSAHGSSLSPAFHALVAARLGDIRLATQYFQQAAEVDLATHMGNAAGGIHMATLGGLWQAAVFGIAGIRLREDGLVIDPHLPLTWKQWSFCLQWRGRKLTIALSREPGSVIVDLQTGGRMMIELGQGVQKIVTQIEPAHRYIARWTGSRWGE
ncbi:MAG TPA: glycosyl hydrolase family 65 protein [Nitrospiraceae bacterium]|nr:glycosyl hydrolase family 65 protein [Nitrospiraceae bacterium]